jgi:hypothetical protein
MSRIFIVSNSGPAIGGIARIAQVQLLQTFVPLAISTALLGQDIGLETIIFALLVAFVVRLGRKARFS